MIIHVVVSQDHIDQGHRNNCSRCPLAIAIQSYCKPNTPIGVGHSIVAYMTNHYDIMSYLPVEASRFVMDFDCGRPVQPFEFDMTILPEYTHLFN